jgi:hypothetical protein
MSLRAGADIAQQRLKPRAVKVVLALALAFELGVALLERAAGRIGAADRALLGGAFGLALPLLAYVLVTRICEGDSLAQAVSPLARHGLDRRDLSLGLALPVAGVLGAFGLLSGVLVVSITRGPGDARWLADAATCAWIGACAGIAYTLALFGASSWGKRGRGRIWLLAADFFFGASDSALALPWPRGHLRNLLGGSAVLQLPQWSALLLLLGTSLAFLWLGAWRNRR